MQNTIIPTNILTLGHISCHSIGSNITRRFHNVQFDIVKDIYRADAFILNHPNYSKDSSFTCNSHSTLSGCSTYGQMILFHTFALLTRVTSEAITDQWVSVTDGQGEPVGSDKAVVRAGGWVGWRGGGWWLVLAI